MKSDSDIFKDQPILGEGEEEFFSHHLANAITVVNWLQTDPDLPALKKAALFESFGHRRLQILDRLLGRIFKMEKKLALEQLMSIER
jgi:hypothetical protein